MDEYVRARPAAQLREFVSCYAGYLLQGPAGLHQGVPSGYLALVIYRRSTDVRTV